MEHWETPVPHLTPSRAPCPPHLFLWHRLILEQDELMRLLDGLVGHACPGMKLKVAATRTLAILGENERVRQAVGRSPIAGRRGVRVLSLDGGGEWCLWCWEQRGAWRRCSSGGLGRGLGDLVCGSSTCLHRPARQVHSWPLSSSSLLACDLLPRPPCRRLPQA